MKLEMQENDILIIPETEFEEAYIKNIAPLGETVQYTGFIKTGATATHIVGLKLTKKRQ